MRIQAMGGGAAEKVKRVKESGYPCIPVTYDDGNIHNIYKEDYDELKGYVNFFRCDRYRITAYYYKK